MRTAANLDALRATGDVDGGQRIIDFRYDLLDADNMTVGDITDLVLSGRIDVFIDTTPGAQPYIKSGQVNGIGLLAPRRRVSAPDFPTMAERGVPGLEIESWVGVFAPTGTPSAVIAKLQQEIAAAMPELAPRFIAAGGEPLSIPTDKVQAQVLGDHAKWLPIVQGMNITLD